MGQGNNFLSGTNKQKKMYKKNSQVQLFIHSEQLIDTLEVLLIDRNP